MDDGAHLCVRDVDYTHGEGEGVVIDLAQILGVDVLDLLIIYVFALHVVGIDAGGDGDDGTGGLQAVGGVIIDPRLDGGGVSHVFGGVHRLGADGVRGEAERQSFGAKGGVTDTGLTAGNQGGLYLGQNLGDHDLVHIGDLGYAGTATAEVQGAGGGGGHKAQGHLTPNAVAVPGAGQFVATGHDLDVGTLAHSLHIEGDRILAAHRGVKGLGQGAAPTAIALQHGTIGALIGGSGGNGGILIDGPVIGVTGLKVAVSEEAVVAGGGQFGQGHVVQIQVLNVAGTTTAEIQEDGAAGRVDGVGQLGPLGGGEPAALDQSLLGGAILDLDVDALLIGLEAEGQLIGGVGGNRKGLMRQAVPVALAHQMQAVVAGIGGRGIHVGGGVDGPAAGIAGLKVAVGDEGGLCDGDVVQPHHFGCTGAGTAEVQENRLGGIQGGDHKGQFGPFRFVEIVGIKSVAAVDIVLDLDVDAAGNGLCPDGDGVGLVGLYRYVLGQHAVPVTGAGGGDAIGAGVGGGSAGRRAIKGFPAIKSAGFKIAVCHQILGGCHSRACAHGQQTAQQGQAG